MANDYVASASADRTSIVWSRKTGRPLMQYRGHRGSVNSCRFHYFDHDLMLTASGDQEIHIWKLSFNEEENEFIPQMIHNPLLALKGLDVISCAEWFQHDQIVSVSWDRRATIWQVSYLEKVL